MLGSHILDVAIGLVLVFLLVSLLASAIREAIEARMKSRAIHLERGIRELLGDSKGSGMAKSFYHHPLIYSLFRDKYVYQEKRTTGGGLPTYIPAKNFAIAMLDLTMRGTVRPEYAAMQTNPETMSAKALRANITKLKNPQLQRAMLAAIDHSGGDLDKIRKNIQDWYDSSMDRVSGWYKRSTYKWLFAIGLVLAAMLNINAVQIGNRLWHDKALREALVTRAEALARDTAYQRKLNDSAFREGDVKRVRADLAELNLPIGWPKAVWDTTMARSTKSVGSFLQIWTFALLGWLLTAFAVTLGAPFWFDALNKIMVIRSTVKPHEKSPEESSEDRQTKTKDKGGKTASDEGTAGSGGSAPSGSHRPTGESAGDLVEREEPGETQFEPHQWDTDLSGKTGREEGIL